MHQLMPTGAKGKNVYQGSLAVQQAQAVKSRGVGHAGGEPSTSMLTSDAPITSEDLPAEGSDDDAVAPPTLPPPTPSPSKRRFSALVSESADTSQSPSTLSGISPISRSVASSSSKRGRMTGAIAISSLGHELSDIKGLLRLDIEQTRLNAEAREERKRQERKHFEERERLEHERREHERREERERLEQVMLLDHEKDPMLIAINRVQEMETDLSPDEIAILAELFNKEHDSAKIYLALKADPVRKAWIKRKLAQSGSG